MNRDNVPKDNGWKRKGKCSKCGFIGRYWGVCKSCGDMQPDCQGVIWVVVRWIDKTKWYHMFTADWPRGYWEEKKIGQWDIGRK